MLNPVKLNNELDLREMNPHAIVMADVKTPMRTVVEINHLTGMPVPVIDGNGKIVGVVGRLYISGQHKKIRFAYEIGGHLIRLLSF